jgi:hypothetical protein
MRRPVSQFMPADVRHHLRGAAKMVVLMVLAASGPSSAGAQRTLGSLSSGERIRISTASSGTSPRVGTIVRAGPDTVVVQSQENGRQVTQSVPRDQITRLDVSMGQTRGRKSQFAGIGFLVGVGVAQLISRDHSEGPAIVDEEDIDALFDGLLIGGIGAGIGAYLGRAREDWRRVSLGTTQLSLRVPRSGHGVGVGARIAF